MQEEVAALLAELLAGDPAGERLAAETAPPGDVDSVIARFESELTAALDSMRPAEERNDPGPPGRSRSSSR